jgi:hypothetical protein
MTNTRAARRLACLFATAVAAGAATGARADTSGRLVLPSPSSAGAVRAVAVRALLEPEDSMVHRAEVVFTLLNPSADPALVDIVLPPAARGVPTVALAGEELPTRRAPQGWTASLRLEPGELAVAVVTERVQAAGLAAVDAARAGWWGRTRGPLLQPMARLEVAHPEASPFVDAPLEVAIVLPGAPLASSLIAEPGCAYEGGTVRWSLPVGEAARAVGVTWPIVESEAFVPATAAEAEAFLADWSGARRLARGELRSVGLAVRGLHGAGGDPEVRALLSSRRPPFAVRPGAPSADEVSADTLLGRAEETWGAPTVAAAAPAPSRPAPPPASPSPAPPPAPPSPPPVEVPAARMALPPREPADAHRPVARGPRDADPQVRVAPDESWRHETLLRSPASVPRDARAARRWVSRALREGHGLSRAVLARESVLALHGKSWEPGYVSDFFSRQTWYRPDPSFSMDALPAGERAAFEVLAEHVAALMAPGALESVALSSARHSEPAPTREPARTAPPAGADVESVESRQQDFALPAEPAPPAAGAPAARAEAPFPAPATPPSAPAAPERPHAEPTGRVPLLLTAPEARLFLAREAARGPLERRRIDEAIALIEARFGKPAEDEAVATRLAFEPWYRARSDYAPELLSQGAREAITLLRRALPPG